MEIPARPVSKEIDSTIDGLLGDLGSINRRKLAAWRNSGADFRRLLERDYVRGLRHGLSHIEVKSLIAAFEGIFPKFNTRSLGLMERKDFRRVAKRVGVHLKAAPYVEHNLFMSSGIRLPARGWGCWRDR